MGDYNTGSCYNEKVKTVYTHGSVEWIDLENPTPRELDSLAKERGLDREIVKGLLSPSMRHTVSCETIPFYLVLHFPAFKDLGAKAAYELDFVLGENFLITARYGKLPALEQFAAALSSSDVAQDLGGVFFGLVRAMLTDIDAKLATLDHWVRDLEQGMFAGHEKLTIFEISEASRHLIDFKKIIAPYPDSFKAVSERGAALFGANFATEGLALTDLHRKLDEKIDLLAESVKELRETNSSILSTRQNETMKMLTWATVIASIVVGIALVWVGLLAV